MSEYSALLWLYYEMQSNNTDTHIAPECQTRASQPPTPRDPEATRTGQPPLGSQMPSKDTFDFLCMTIAQIRNLRNGRWLSRIERK